MEESEIKKEIKKGGRGGRKHGFKKKGKPGQKNNHPMPMNILIGTASALAKKDPRCM